MCRAKAPTPKLEPVTAMKSDGADPAAVSKAPAPASKEDGSAPKKEEPQTTYAAKKAWWSGGKEGARSALRLRAEPHRRGHSHPAQHAHEYMLGYIICQICSVAVGLKNIDMRDESFAALSYSRIQSRKTSLS